MAELETLPNYTKNATINALLLYSKYLGSYSDFKGRLKANGIKLYHPSALDAFLRILNASSNNQTENTTLVYYRNIQPCLKENERLFSKFLLFSGLRTSEAINSFNLIIQLSKEGKLSDYYHSEWKILQHVKYPKTFCRKNKNCYLSFIEKPFLEQIANSQPVSYDAIKLRLQRAGFKMELNKFRDWFGSYMVNSRTLTELEQNLLCGRVNGIFVRHYWNCELVKIGERIFRALDNIN